MLFKFDRIFKLVVDSFILRNLCLEILDLPSLLFHGFSKCQQFLLRFSILMANWPILFIKISHLQFLFYIKYFLVKSSKAVIFLRQLGLQASYLFLIVSGAVLPLLDGKS